MVQAIVLGLLILGLAEAATWTPLIYDAPPNATAWVAASFSTDTLVFDSSGMTVESTSPNYANLYGVRDGLSSALLEAPGAFFAWRAAFSVQLSPQYGGRVCVGSTESSNATNNSWLCDIAEVRVGETTAGQADISMYGRALATAVEWDAIDGSEATVLVRRESVTVLYNGGNSQLGTWTADTGDLSAAPQPVSAAVGHTGSNAAEEIPESTSRTPRGTSTHAVLGGFQFSVALCPEGCSACTSETVCTACFSAAVTLESLCSVCSMDAHLDPATNCTTCLTGYSLTSSATCEPICSSSRCVCTEPFTCDSCIGLFAEPLAACSSCQEGYLYTTSGTSGNASCEPICTSAGCVGCTAPETCTSCTEQYALGSDNSCRTCVEGEYPDCGAVVVNCFEHGSQGACQAAAGCQWCGIDEECRTAAERCTECADLVDAGDCDAAASASLCKWCALEESCKLPDATCLPACSDVLSRDACDSFALCRYCGWMEQCLNASEFSAVCSFNCSAHNADPDACDATPACHFCNTTEGSEGYCSDADKECSFCVEALTPGECDLLEDADNTSCVWCSTDRTCQNAKLGFCAACSNAAKSLCGTTQDYAGCWFCAATQTCMEEESADAWAFRCNCSNLNKTACSGGCRWCATLGRCLALGVTCPTCTAATTKDFCGQLDGCTWIPSMLVCAPEGSTSMTCEQQTSRTTCEVFKGCHFCDPFCVSIDVNCTPAAASSSAGQLVSEEPPPGAALFVVIAVCCAAGAAVVIGAIILGAVLVRRRRRSMLSVAVTGDVFLDRVSAATLTVGSLASLAREQPETLGLDVPATPVSFGTNLAVDTAHKAKFTVKNIGAERVGIAVRVPSEEDVRGKYELGVDQAQLSLDPQASCEVTVLLTPRCTTKVRSFVALVVDGTNSYTTVALEAASEQSTKLDWDELQIGRQIGKGAAGAVYAGTYHGMPVAIKEINQTIWEVSGTRLGILREMDLLHRLRSPFVVCFFGVVFSTEHTALVMELVERGSLRPLLLQSGDTLPMQARLKIALNCAQGMEFLHTNGILHRDLKTDNLLVVSTSPDDEVLVKLTDFGEARSVADEAARQYTQGVGTPISMAPEILNGAAYGMAADVFSFGVVLWELATGRMPYDEFATHFAIVAFVSSGKRLEIPAESPLAGLIAQCWEQDPSARPTFAQIVQELKKIVASHSHSHQQQQQAVVAEEDATTAVEAQ